MTYVVVDNAGTAIGLEVDGVQRLFPAEDRFPMAEVEVHLMDCADAVGLVLPPDLVELLTEA